MKKKAIEKIFVLAVFGLIYLVLAKNVSFIGHVVALPGFYADEADQVALGELEAKNYFFDMEGYFNLEVDRLKAGNRVLARDEDRTYSITVLRVLQDYPSGEEHASVLISPTDKRIIMHEGDFEVIDFNLDGLPDARIELLSVSQGTASFSIRTP